VHTNFKNNRFVCAYEQNFISSPDVKKAIRNLNSKSVMWSSLKEVACSWRVETAATFVQGISLIGCRQSFPHNDSQFEDDIFITLPIVEKGRHKLRIGRENLDTELDHDGKDRGYSLSIGSLLVFDPCVVHMLYDDTSTMRRVAPQGWAALQFEITKKEFKAITKDASNRDSNLIAYSLERFSEFLT
jgi:hypothetical protein